MFVSKQHYVEWLAQRCLASESRRANSHGMRDLLPYEAFAALVGSAADPNIVKSDGFRWCGIEKSAPHFRGFNGGIRSTGLASETLDAFGITDRVCEDLDTPLEATCAWVRAHPDAWPEPKLQAIVATWIPHEIHFERHADRVNGPTFTSASFPDLPFTVLLWPLSTKIVAPFEVVLDDRAALLDNLLHESLHQVLAAVSACIPLYRDTHAACTAPCVSASWRSEEWNFDHALNAYLVYKIAAWLRGRLFLSAKPNQGALRKMFAVAQARADACASELARGLLSASPRLLKPGGQRLFDWLLSENAAALLDAIPVDGTTMEPWSELESE